MGVGGTLASGRGELSRTLRHTVDGAPLEGPWPTSSFRRDGASPTARLHLKSVYLDRRAFLKSATVGMAALGLGACGSEFTPSELVDETPDVPVAEAGFDDATMLHPLQSICPSRISTLPPETRPSTFSTKPSATVRKDEVATACLSAGNMPWSPSKLYASRVF